MEKEALKLVARRMSRRMGELAQPHIDFLATLSTEQLEDLDEASERFESVTELQEWIDQRNR